MRSAPGGSRSRSGGRRPRRRATLRATLSAAVLIALALVLIGLFAAHWNWSRLDSAARDSWWRAAWPLLAALGLALAILLVMLRRLAGSTLELSSWLESASAAPLELHPRPPLTLREHHLIRDAVEHLLRRHRDAQSELVRLEGTLRPLLELAREGVLILDREERIVIWNRAAEEMLGFAGDDAQGCPYGELLVTEDRRYEALVERAKREGSVKDISAVRRTTDGRELQVSLSRFLIRDQEGQPAGAVEILRDTAQELHIQQELITAEKMTAVGKMASKVVHEIRNPLASFNLNVDLLGDCLKGLNAEQAREAAEILQSLKRETRRLRQITEEYLQFSRLPRKQFHLEDVNRVLLELADFARPEFRRKGIQILLRLDDRQPRAYFDAGLLRQAGLNLVRNAMDAADNQSHIRLSTEDLGEEVEIRMADDGCGIKEEDLPRIFEPFYTTKRDGTGLGLAIVRQIVEEHGGRIQVRSLPDRGTTFILRLPKAPPRAAAAGKGQD
ncbi:MAG: PAS domain-containing protein [Candidatus Eisenbacteria bacterium]|nr:PAS domain-containing protein [Candidatus Eisenbacteria bacterium]